MRHVFMDESGDLGVGVGSDYLVMAFLSPESRKNLNKQIKNFNAHLIRNGWNKALEIKAANLWHAPKSADLSDQFRYKKDPAEAIRNVLTAIAQLDGYIEYVCVKLDTLSEGLRSAPEGILYNHFA